MLRYFVKTERLTDCADNSEAGTLSNYHIKTLMLWACELKPRSWWTENLNIVRICVELLHSLSVWLTDTRCPHYFNNNCNLLDNSFNVGSKLMSIDEEYLSAWFVNNYIGRCAQLCPDNVSRLFSNVTTIRKLQNAASEIVRLRLNTSLLDLWRAVKFAEKFILPHLSVYPFTARSCVCWMRELAKIDRRLTVLFSGVALLHVACKLSRNGFNDEVMNILTTIFGRNSNQCCSLLLSQAKLDTSEQVELLQKYAIEHLTTYRQDEVRDFGSLASIVSTDFEALYAYKCDDYERCLQLSTQNVHTLLYARGHMTNVPTHPEFIQLLDDDIVSLTALTVIVNPERRINDSTSAFITQVTLSLYLVTQCQLKLHHSATSLAQTLSDIKVAQSAHRRYLTLDHLTLKLIERKVSEQLKLECISHKSFVALRCVRYF